MRFHVRALAFALGAAIAALIAGSAAVAKPPAPPPPATLTFNADSWDFGSVGVGESSSHDFTLTYTYSGKTGSGKIALGLTQTGTPFAISANTCPKGGLKPNASCTVTVRYTPAATGANDTATLKATAGSLSSKDVSLTGASPSNNQPPTAESGTSPDAYAGSAIPIRLNGSDADGDSLTFAIASGPSHGTLGPITRVHCMTEPMLIAEPSSCSAVVTYFPASTYTGDDSFTYTVNDGQVDSTAATISIPVRQSPVTGAPTVVDFGQTQIGPIAYGTKTVTFMNTSSSTVYLDPNIGIGPGFKIAGGNLQTCENGLAAGGNCTAEIEFTTPAPGPVYEYLDTTWYDAPAFGNEVAHLFTPLTGTGVVKVDQSPTQLLFDQVAVDDSTTKSITFTNKTTTTLYLHTFEGPGAGFTADESGCSSTSGIAPEASCTFSISFSPTAAGMYHSSLQTDWGDQPSFSSPTIASIVTPLHGSTSGLSFAITVQPTSLAFGDVAVDTTSDPQTLTFTNDTTAPVAMVNLGAASGFDYAGYDNCSEVQPGGSCEISVTFSPTEAVPYSGVLHSEWSVPGSETRVATFDTPLTGTGVPAPSGHVYWANSLDDTIGGASLEGAGANQSFITGASYPDAVAADSSHVYWANYGTGTIGRANLDGTNPNQSFITGGSNINAIAVDSNYIYWTNFDYGTLTTTIGRANIDGTGTANQSFATIPCPEMAYSCRASALAVNSSHIYWADFDNYTIGRANIDGTEPNDAFITNNFGYAQSGVAVDSNYIYWTNYSGTTIGRANLDGTNPNQSFISTGYYPYGVAVDDSHIYWANSSAGTIGRADLAGTNVTQSFISGGSTPNGVAVSTD